MAERISTFLMFEGRAEEAMDHYAELFPAARRLTLERWGVEGPGAEGKVFRGELALAGQTLLFTDSVVSHEFGFTPAISLFVECENEEELDRLFAGLGEGGEVMMPVDAYPFARRFGWIADRFGVSWQLSLT